MIEKIINFFSFKRRRFVDLSSSDKAQVMALLKIRSKDVFDEQIS